jgi:hypothetical protein
MLSIEPTKNTPTVLFADNGKLKMEGRAMPENVNVFFKPLIDFVQEISADEVIFDINLEYFNTATSKKLLELLKHLDANNNVNSVLVNWFFEEDDDDSVETAEIFEESLIRVKFCYREYVEAA